jgi:hypothetical protein
MSHRLLTPCAKARWDLCSRHPTERRRMQSRTETEPFGPVAASDPGTSSQSVQAQNRHVNPDLRSLPLFSRPGLLFF